MVPKEIQISKRLPAASSNVVTIRSIVLGTTSKGDPVMHFIVSGGEELPDYQEFEGINVNEQVGKLSFYFSDNAMAKVTLPTLKMIAEKCGLDNYLSIEGDYDAKTFVELITPMFVNAQFTLTLNGEASYKLKDNWRGAPVGEEFWRNVYARFNPYLNRGSNKPRSVEKAEDLDRVVAFFDKNPLYITDAGQPPRPNPAAEAAAAQEAAQAQGEEVEGDDEW